MSLSIVMATYDEFDNVYWTVQMLRLYGGERVEIIVCDNNPFSKHGEAILNFIKSVPDAKYMTLEYHTGTSQAKNAAIWAAKNKWVLCMDAHVALYPGVLKKLKKWCDNSTSDDLFHGPLGYTHDPSSFATHFNDTWSAGMWGQWAFDPKHMLGPTPIKGMGMGLFLTQRESWLGYPGNNRGFGGEERIIHEKYRANGRQTILLPWLKWQHKFHRVILPHVVDNRDKFRNHISGLLEIGMDITPCVEHFKTILSKEHINSILKELQSPKKPLVSCICNTYNRLDFIPEAIESFNRQTYPNKELIIVNDTPEQFIRLEKPQSNIKLYNLSKRFNSYYEKLNFAHRVAGGDVFILWDDDDISLPTRISTEMKVLEETGKSYTHPVGHLIHIRDDIFFEYNEAQLPQRGVYTRDFIKLIGPFPHNITDQWIHEEAMKRNAMAQHIIPTEKPIYIYRFGMGQSHLGGWDDKYEKIGKNPIEKKGTFKIKPHWTQDWLKLKPKRIVEGQEIVKIIEETTTPKPKKVVKNKELLDKIKQLKKNIRHSIIIPTHNDPGIFRTLKCLYELKNNCEIIIADDCSEQSYVKKIKNLYPEVIITQHKEKPLGAPCAYALGAEAAQGEVLLFIHPHTRPQTGSIETLLEAAVQTKSAVTPTITQLEKRTWEPILKQKANGLIIDKKHLNTHWLKLEDMEKIDEAYYKNYAITKQCFAIHRAAYDAVGGWDRGLTNQEDISLSLRLFCLGYTIYHTPNASIAHLFKERNNDTQPHQNLINKLRIIHNLASPKELEEFHNNWKNKYQYYDKAITLFNETCYTASMLQLRIKNSLSQYWNENIETISPFDYEEKRELVNKTPVKRVENAPKDSVKNHITQCYKCKKFDRQLRGCKLDPELERHLQWIWRLNNNQCPLEIWKNENKNMTFVEFKDVLKNNKLIR